MDAPPARGAASAIDLARFAAQARQAASVIQDRPKGTRWLLDCDNDADGLTAAAVMARALLHAGQRFTIRPSRDKTEAHYRALLDEPADGFILLDKGTSHAAQLAADAKRNGRPVLIVDHHNVTAPPGEGVTLLNPRTCGLDGSRDASGATTAFALALELAGLAAWAWAPLALSGAVGDWQHMGGWQGWNLHLVTESEKTGHVRTVAMPRFIGVSLAEALSHARPAIPSLAGDPAASAAFLRSIQVDPEAEVEELDAEARTRLVSAVVARHLAAGANGQGLDRLVGPLEWNVKLDASLRQVFRLVDACARESNPQAALAWLMGDPSAKTEVTACFQRYRQALADGVRALRDGNVTARAALQVAWTERADYTGMVAGIGMTHVVADRRRPLAILAVRPDGLVQASTRGLHEQVARGMDLGAACAKAAHTVGAEGGGHPVAAGAVVPKDAAEPFLAALDAALVDQKFLEA
ncbi:MAG: DHH family phosphoesterase [Candidatus Thermoplasmatota archaeon]